jgi:SPP1 gp7 family putative phage head morphogenesis protein
MTIYADDRRLFDIATRQQVLIEGYKNWQAREFNATVAELAKDMKRILGNVSFDKLSVMTKLQLNRLIAQMRASLARTFSQYIRKILSMLRKFMSVDLDVTRRIFASVFVPPAADGTQPPIGSARAQSVIEEESGQLVGLFGLASVLGAGERIWAYLLNTPNPANGMKLPDFLKVFAMSAQANILNSVNRAWANGSTVAQLQRELIGAPGERGALQRIASQNLAVVSTSIQFISAVNSQSVLSLLFRRYRWDSVMDSATTDICRSRNGHIYVFGEGPIPPAHIGCRSDICPIVGNTNFDPPSLFAWLREQPAEIKRLMLGAGNVSLLDSIKANELNSLLNISAVDIERYSNEIPLILTR